jgi:hypothetical protein
MSRACGLPFLSQGRQVAASHPELKRMLADLMSDTSGREAGALKLMSVTEARQRLGRLPAGAEYGQQMLVGRTTLGGIPVTLLLQRKDGRWKVIGLNR